MVVNPSAAIARSMAARLPCGWNIIELEGGAAKEVLASSRPPDSEEVMLFAADATILEKCPH
jgi:hypothetical protein